VEYLNIIASVLPGELTLNQLRILTVLNMVSRYAQVPVSNKQLATNLKLPESTVSRAIIGFQEKGWVVGRKDPDDARRTLYEVVGNRTDPIDEKLEALNRLFWARE